MEESHKRATPSQAGGRGRPVRRFKLFVLISALFFCPTLPMPEARAQTTNEGEFNSSHCHYRHTTTTYRYLFLDLPPALHDNTNSGAARWNGDFFSPTHFQSAGTTWIPQRLRVVGSYQPNNAHPAWWSTTGCPFAGNWTDESAIVWNTAHWEGWPSAHRTNTAIHEFGHAIGLAHSKTSCVGATPLSVMANQVEAYTCSGGQFGPYSRDSVAAGRIGVRSIFYYRNTLTTGQSLTQVWQTEADDRFFRGRPVAGAYGPVSFDDDKYAEGSERIAVVYRAQGGVGTQSAVRTNFPVGTNYAFPSYMVAGDFNGNGADGLASFHNGVWRLSSAFTTNPYTSFSFGQAGDIPVMGDWNGNGIHTVGTFRPSTGQWFLRNSNTGGPPNLSFYYGIPGDLPVVGNWHTLDSKHEIGVVRGRRWFLRRDLSTGFADVEFDFPASGTTSGMQPVLGDWNNNGQFTPGYLR